MNEELAAAVEDMNATYISQIKEGLRIRWNLLSIDLSQKEVYEVLCGQLARQVTLATQFLNSSNCWTMDLAPIILRCLADNYINFSWIAQNPTDRAKKFILYGLGQEKLMLEHRKQQMEKEGINPEDDPVTLVTEEWLNRERYTFLTEVNLGAWSGLNTRKMAEESGCIDFYNYVYTPFSSVVHNTWGHIAKFNLRESDNPLHKFLKIPFVDDLYIDLHNINLAAKYTDKLIRKFDEVFALNIPGTSPYEKLFETFTSIENEFLSANRTKKDDESNQSENDKLIVDT